MPRAGKNVKGFWAFLNMCPTSLGSNFDTASGKALYLSEIK